MGEEPYLATAVMMDRLQELRDTERKYAALLAALDALVTEMRESADRAAKTKQYQQTPLYISTHHWADRLAAALAKHREKR